MLELRLPVYEACYCFTFILTKYKNYHILSSRFNQSLNHRSTMVQQSFNL